MPMPDCVRCAVQVDALQIKQHMQSKPGLDSFLRGDLYTGICSGFCGNGTESNVSALAK